RGNSICAQALGDRGPEQESDRLAPVEYRTFEAPAGERLDVAIAMALEMSRSYAKELVNEGYVQLDGRPVGKPATKLSGTEIVSVTLPPPRPVMVEPEDIPLDIIYQDDELAAINKPPQLTAHPTATVRSGTVVNALLGRMQLSKDRLFDPSDEDYRPGIVHRLDRDTSGVMVVAKNDEAHRHLSASFKKRLTEKEYIAIAVGSLEDEVLVDAAIGRHPVKRQSMTVGGSNPKNAATRFRVIARTPGHVLVKAKPHSGRTHQIRVHLAHLGSPVLADQVYGRPSEVISRQALHAHRLTIPHPRDNQAITFVAQVPVDMVDAWLRLRGSWPPAGEEDL
ncbi:MAG: RluA family pseudouridine synthase, partial [Trueperaceae bacterium]